MASRIRNAWPALAGLAIAIALAFAPAHARAKATDWLGRVNEIRQGSQLPPVSDNPAWSAGISAHLRYLAKTPQSLREGEYESAHTENPESPYYTDEGSKEGASSDLTYSSSSDVDAIDIWLTAPFHAIGILRPGLREVAFARESPGGNAGLDVISGLSPTSEPRLVLYPGPGATIDLPAFGGESPSPIETCVAQHPGADYRSPGLPLIALLTESPDPGTSASLTAPDGSHTDSGGADLCIVTAANFQTTDNVYGPTGADILSSDDAALVIPRKPLVAGTYTATLRQPEKPDITWSFNSAPRPEPQDTEVGSVARSSQVCTWTNWGRARRLRVALRSQTALPLRRPGPWEKVGVSVRTKAFTAAGKSYSGLRRRWS